MTTHPVTDLKAVSVPAATAPDNSPVILDEWRVVRVLVATAATVAALGVFSWATRGQADFPGRDLIAGLFDPVGEANISAAFSALLLLGISVLFAAIAHAKSRDTFARVWRGMAWVFAYLSLDEFAQLHERPVEFIRDALGPAATSGILHHAWVIPYLLFVVLTFSVTVKFLLHLPARTRALFIAAGALYVGGAMGFEMIEGPIAEVSGGTDSTAYWALVSIEELCEMSGMILLIATLFHYIRTTLPGMRLAVSLMPRTPDA